MFEHIDAGLLVVDQLIVDERAWLQLYHYLLVHFCGRLFV